MDEQLAQLTARMTELGAPDPEGWARSEIEEDIPQQARFLVLRSLWPWTIDRLTASPREIKAASRLLDAGADPADVAQLIASTAVRAIFDTLVRIDEGRDWEAPEDSPGWALIEVEAGHEEDQLPGRWVGGLHESLSGVVSDERADAAMDL